MCPGRTLLSHFSRIEKIRVRRKEDIKKDFRKGSSSYPHYVSFPSQKKVSTGPSQRLNSERSFAGWKLVIEDRSDQGDKEERKAADMAIVENDFWRAAPVVNSTY